MVAVFADKQCKLLFISDRKMTCCLTDACKSCISVSLDEIRQDNPLLRPPR